MPISERLRNAVKTANERQYRLAHKIHVHPTVLSAWLNGITEPKPAEPRIIALGTLVGVPADECFEPEGQKCAG